MEVLRIDEQQLAEVALLSYQAKDLAQAHLESGGADAPDEDHLRMFVVVQFAIYLKDWWGVRLINECASEGASKLKMEERVTALDEVNWVEVGGEVLDRWFPSAC